MISEASFARAYSSFWQEFTPWINDYTSFVNKGLVERKYEPLNSTDESIHRSINNVTAVVLFQNMIEQNNSDIDTAFEKAREIVKNFPRNGLDTYNLDNDQMRIIKLQSSRLVDTYKGNDLIFNPQFDGCGILASCQGDLMYQKTLVEIKAGERNISSSDIKQVIVYCALNWLAKSERKIEIVEIFNPRQGVLWQSSLSSLISSISSLPTEDLFEQIGIYLYESSEDIVL
ncbi:MAG: hypothetical protein EP338_10070 [Bacteroidetes bacterium]|nr:MAG: hypothetical protein EP338_10070 [Bacteroidota bacterium]